MSVQPSASRGAKHAPQRGKSVVGDGTFEEELQRGVQGQQLAGCECAVRGARRTSYSSLAMVSLGALGEFFVEGS